MNSIVIASHNKHKCAEIKYILGNIPFRIFEGWSVVPDLIVEETGNTYFDNARLKALSFARATGMVALADDSGLEIKALNGDPGVRSNRYFKHCLSDDEKAEALLNELSRRSVKDRSARFVCVSVLVRGGNVIHVAEGVVNGFIGYSLRGCNGFGYDPVFIYPPLGKTFAELNDGEKAEVSHRGHALRKMREFILQSVL